jgi:hypothetical protein
MRSSGQEVGLTDSHVDFRSSLVLCRLNSACTGTRPLSPTCGCRGCDPSGPSPHLRTARSPLESHLGGRATRLHVTLAAADLGGSSGRAPPPPPPQSLPHPPPSRHTQALSLLPYPLHPPPPFNPHPQPSYSLPSPPRLLTLTLALSLSLRWPPRAALALTLALTFTLILTPALHESTPPGPVTQRLTPSACLVADSSTIRSRLPLGQSRRCFILGGIGIVAYNRAARSSVRTQDYSVRARLLRSWACVFWDGCFCARAAGCCKQFVDHASRCL